jgi:phosphate/sulfate permease
VLIAAVCEFAGAFFLGAAVTNTVRSKIIEISLYKSQPDILMLGMLCALITAAFWLLMVTYWEIPVSTTHTMIAAIIGFSMAAKGFDSINWEKTVQVFISWVASPLVSGLITFLFFSSVRKFVLR